MPSGYLSTLPTDVLLDAGVLTIGGALIGVTRGGVAFEREDEWRNVEFDGKRSPMYGLDRKIAHVERFRGTFIAANAADLARWENAEATGTFAPIAGITGAAAGVSAAFSYRPGDSLTTATVARASTATMLTASALLERGAYVEDVRLTFQRGGGGLCVVVFPLALCKDWSVRGQEKSEVEVAVAFEARLELTGSATTDTAPYHVEIS